MERSRFNFVKVEHGATGARTGAEMIVQMSGGGLDSTALTLLDHKHIDAIAWIDYGQVPAPHELRAINRTRDRLKDPVTGKRIALHSITDEDLSERMKAMNPRGLLFGLGDEAFVIGRNLTLLNLLAIDLIARHGPDQHYVILLGLCREQMMFSDADPDFVQQVNALFAISFGTVHTPAGARQRVSVLAPWIATPKRDFMELAHKEALSHGGPDALWRDSFTCWTPVGDDECGVCYHCTKKAKLMAEIGVTHG